MEDRLDNADVELCVLVLLSMQETIQLWQRKCEDALQSLGPGALFDAWHHQRWAE
jgi:hypothetical protein